MGTRFFRRHAAPRRRHAAATPPPVVATRSRFRCTQADVMKRSCDTHALDAVRPPGDHLAAAASESVMVRQSNVVARRSRMRKYTPPSVGPRTVLDVRR